MVTKAILDYYQKSKMLKMNNTTMIVKETLCGVYSLYSNNIEKVVK